MGPGTDEKGQQEDMNSLYDQAMEDMVADITSKDESDEEDGEDDAR